MYFNSEGCYMKCFLLKHLVCNGVFVFLCLVNLQAQQENTLIEEINKINCEMAQALIAGNSNKSLSYYTDDVISIPDKTEIMVGIEMIRRANALMIAYGVKVNQFDLITREVFSCDNLVTEIGYYHIVLIAPGMTREIDENGKYVTIWERQSDGHLKIKIELWNMVTPDEIPSHF